MGAAAEAVTTSAAAEAVRVAGRPDHGAAGARLSELFARHGATVLGLCRVLLRHREEAEDAVQQTFLAAYRSLLNGNEPRHPAAWLATIARNECWGRIEQRMREPLSEREPESTLPDPVAAAAARADLAELWRAIGGLPRQQRKALLLREFSGLSYAELADALSVSEPAVESLLFRARRELRLRLQPVYRSVGGVAPLAAIREAFARAIGGMPDPSTTGELAKVVSAPLVAKLAAGAAAIVVAGGTVAAVESDAIRPDTSLASAPAAKPVTPSALRTAAPSVSLVTASVRSKPRLAARARSVRVLSPLQRPAGGASPPVPALARPAPSEVAPSPAEPAGSAPVPPSASASAPDTSEPDAQSSSASGGPDESAVGSDGEGSAPGAEPQSNGDGTSSSSGDTTGEDSGSSGSGDTGSSGDGSSGGASGLGDGGGSGHDGGGGSADGGGTGD
jgi:RNA polymerase sigma factor (sigma-70 family)